MSRIALRNLAVRQLYGRDFDALGIDGLADGVTVVFGPNGSGKTTLTEASSRLFNAHKIVVGRSDRIRADITVDGSTRKLTIDGPIDEPDWPQSPRVGLYRLRIADIIAGPAPEDTERIHDALAGGIGLTQLEISRAGRPPRDALIQSGQNLQETRRKAEELQRSEAQLQEQQQERDRATSVQEDLRVFDAWLQAAQIDTEGQQIAEEIAALDQQYLGIAQQDESAADDAEAQLRQLEVAREEVAQCGRAIKQCATKRARSFLKQEHQEALKRLQDDAARLSGLIDAASQRSRECEALVANVTRELQRIRPDNRRACGALDDANLYAHVQRLCDGQNALALAEGELDRVQIAATSALQDFRRASGDSGPHPAAPCSRDQVQAIVNCDQQITTVRAAIDADVAKVNTARLEVQEAQTGLELAELPMRQIIDELLSEPSIAKLQDDERECQVKRKAYLDAAQSLAGSESAAASEIALQQALEALRDWLRAIPQQHRNELPLAIPIGTFAAALICLLLGFVAAAYVAGTVAAIALVAVGVVLILRRKQRTVDDQRTSIASRIPQAWRPAEWSTDAVAARYCEAAGAKFEGHARQRVGHELRLKAEQVELLAAQAQLKSKLDRLAQYVRVQNESAYRVSYLVERLSDLHSATRRFAGAKELKSQHERQLDELTSQRKQLLAQIDCPADTGAGAVHWADKLEALLRAEDELQQRQNALDGATRARNTAANTYHAYLSQHDWSLEGDPQILADDLKEWFEVSDRLGDAEVAQKRASDDLDRVRAERKRIDGDITKLFSAYGYKTTGAVVDAIEPFRAWFDRSERWVQAVRRASQLRRNLRSRLNDAGTSDPKRAFAHRAAILRQRENSARVRRDLVQQRHDKIVAARGKRAGFDFQTAFARHDLPEHPDLPLITARREILVPMAEQRDALSDRITETQTLIRERGEQQVVADAERERARAIKRVQDWLDAKVDEVATTTVVDRIRELFRDEEQPRLISSANLWLERLTSGRYGGIEFDGDGISVIDGIDESRRKKIRELSTGAQVHLAVAVRLAVIESSEDGHAFPLFLDEVMATSDAAATNAVAEAVKKIAADRQVVIFTNQADDLHALRQVLGNDLEVKCLAGAAPPSYAPPAAPPAVPARDSQGDGFPLASPIGLWPPRSLATILPELGNTAASLHDAIEALDGDGRARLEAKIKALEAVRQEVAKSHRRVQWAEIHGEKWAGGAMYERFQAAWEASGGRPRQFLELVKNIDGIRQPRIDGCEQWLSDKGYLVEPPAFDQLVQIAFTSLPADYPDRKLVAQALALTFSPYL